jgi:hypothetical protein
MIDLKPATAQQLTTVMRRADKLTIRHAASLLGRTEIEVMDMVADGELMAWTHSAAHGELLPHTNHKTGVVQQLPRIAPDTDPTSVRVALDDVVWMWCVQEEMPRYYPDLPPKEAVERRLQALNEQAKCAIAPLTQPPAPAQSPEAPEPVAPVPKPARVNRRTWWEVASPYMAQVLKNGQFSTAKELYHALVSKAGPDSPFDAGTGAYRGSLFVRDVAVPLALKTVQNRFNDLRKLAQTSTP